MSRYKKPLWVCSRCKMPNWHNRTVCYNCARRRDYGKSPEQKELGL